MKREIELLPPIMPNFVQVKTEPGKKQDGFHEGIKIPISDFTEAEAVEYGELMKQAFLLHWKSKKSCQG